MGFIMGERATLQSTHLTQNVKLILSCYLKAFPSCFLVRRFIKCNDSDWYVFRYCRADFGPHYSIKKLLFSAYGIFHGGLKSALQIVMSKYMDDELDIKFSK